MDCWSIRRVNDHDYTALCSALNSAVDILYRNRTPDPEFVAAFDTLKQSRAMIDSVVKRSGDLQAVPSVELAA
jgi:hypothetical protein